MSSENVNKHHLNTAGKGAELVRLLVIRDKFVTNIVSVLPCPGNCAWVSCPSARRRTLRPCWGAVSACHLARSDHG